MAMAVVAVGEGCDGVEQAQQGESESALLAEMNTTLDSEQADGVMSESCSSSDEAVRFSEWLHRDDFMAVLSGSLRIVGEETVEEQLSNGTLTGTAWKVVFDEVHRVSASGVSSEAAMNGRLSALVLRNEGKIFTFSNGMRFVESECPEVSRPIDDGALGRRVESAQGEEVLVMLQRTAAWGWVVRGLAPVTDGRVLTLTRGEISLEQTLTISGTEDGLEPRVDVDSSDEEVAFPPGICQAGVGCE